MLDQHFASYDVIAKDKSQYILTDLYRVRM